MRILVIFGIVLLATVTIVSHISFAEEPSQGTASISAGRYLAIIAGCNDCHTKAWTASEAKIPEKDWLTGDITGWIGPWGTTYAPNLRLFFQNLSEDAWVDMAHKLQARPPMPWWSLHAMKDADLRSIYRLVKSLGPVGQAGPSYQPPGQQPKAPYFRFVPPPEDMPAK